jgi:hypothetical protein
MARHAMTTKSDANTASDTFVHLSLRHTNSIEASGTTARTIASHLSEIRTSPRLTDGSRVVASMQTFKCVPPNGRLSSGATYMRDRVAESRTRTERSIVAFEAKLMRGLTAA